MWRVISVILLGIVLYPLCFAQQTTYGYKISGNGNIVSNVFLIQNGFVLDSVTNTYYSPSNTYRFEYDERGKIKRDINFRRFVIYTMVNGRQIRKNIPGYRDYYFNERGEVDSMAYGFWNDSLWVSDSSGCRINYSKDGKVVSEKSSSKGTVTSLIQYNYDSNGNLLLRKNRSYGSNGIVEDTAYNIYEYDSQNRLKLTKSFGIVDINNIYQDIYQYDSSGNVSVISQTLKPVPHVMRDTTIITIDTIYTEKYYLLFDESGKMLDEMHWYYRFINTWDLIFDKEIQLSYDGNGRILKLGDYGAAWFHYDTYGNLDTLVNLHSTSNGYFSKYTATLILIDSYGNHIILPNYYDYNYFYYSKIVTGVEKNNVNVNTFTLSQNYPNPFNPSTTIQYSIPLISFVTIKVYDILGREIETLVNERKSVGNYSVNFNSSRFTSGVYFYRLQAGSFISTKKFVLVK